MPKSAESPKTPKTNTKNTNQKLFITPQTTISFGSVTWGLLDENRHN